jgi:hypothetical protein
MKRREFLLAAGGAALPSKFTFPELRKEFEHPSSEFKTRPLWFWNGRLDKRTTAEIMERSKDSGYAGFGILPGRGMTPEFMSPEFLDQYRFAVDTAERLGFRMCLYDEYWFPSGSAGGFLAKQFPEALSKRLDLKSIDVRGPAPVNEPVPSGLLMSAVGMNPATWERVDLRGSIRDGVLDWQAPAGEWRVMFFSCVTDGARGLVDYLEPDSVKKFLALTYDKYYGALGRHFGKTINCAFYDEPTMHWSKGRSWTPAFNEKFKLRHGWDPAPFYPALWVDIGPRTAAVRNALFGFRAELYADGFIRTLQQWCTSHGIALTGHQDQEEVVNPVGLCGDLIKCFRDQEIPGIDQISQYGRASKAYKVVSSAACNHDRPLVMTECYGAVKNMPVANLYKEVMDQFAKGINWMVPHAVWYDPVKITFPPELSYRSPVYGPALPAYNEYVARLQCVLQRGGHVADIAVLYPIATLQAGYRFDAGEPYKGGVIPPEADYMDIGEMLSLQVRRDFTFLHPEVLDEKCTVSGKLLRLRNRVHPQEYRVFVMPGSQVIHWSNLRRVKEFYESGGIVIATTRLPEQSAEPGHDDDVRKTVASIFGPPGEIRRIARGGQSCFFSQPGTEALREFLDSALPEGDVVFEDSPAVSDGNLSYIHKRLDKREVYFFANSSSGSVDCRIRLRGRPKLQEWDPHTGTIRPAAAKGGPGATLLRLHLGPVQSRMFLGD